MMLRATNIRYRESGIHVRNQTTAGWKKTPELYFNRIDVRQMLKRTPFYEIHKDLDAKLVEFGGWEMPVQYESIRKEHRAVRESVGLFDISHMGEFYIHGPEAEDLIQYVTVNDVAKLSEGQAQYSVMCYEDGGIVDDLLVYKLFDGGGYMLVVNAANIEKDFEWIEENRSFDAELRDGSADTCLLAVQGPKSVETLQKLTDTDLGSIKFYRFERGTLAGFDAIVISATGYTGEKGFELYFDRDAVNSRSIWEAIMEAGEEFSIEPCGLGARDTLRLEMGFALYGNDITADTNPLEARLGWLTKIDKGDFIGRDALKRLKEEGLSRKLVGFVMDDERAIPRADYPIFDGEGEEIGFVTSGSQSITLGKGIGMGYVPMKYSEEGTKIAVGIRNRKVKATVHYPPFVEK
ncbi:MAG: glycine cleavage system aminomethyltransferase GcvT [Balneolaceae bacterium]|nr:glycine cleavage system aminomethyltransferase GcvT [Balneolaceae bacterium]